MRLGFPSLVCYKSIECRTIRNSYKFRDPIIYYNYAFIRTICTYVLYAVWMRNDVRCYYLYIDMRLKNVFSTSVFDLRIIQRILYRGHRRRYAYKYLRSGMLVEIGMNVCPWLYFRVYGNRWNPLSPPPPVSIWLCSARQCWESNCGRPPCLVLEKLFEMKIKEHICQ